MNFKLSRQNNTWERGVWFVWDFELSWNSDFPYLDKAGTHLYVSPICSCFGQPKNNTRRSRYQKNASSLTFFCLLNLSSMPLTKFVLLHSVLIFSRNTNTVCVFYGQYKNTVGGSGQTWNVYDLWRGLCDKWNASTGKDDSPLCLWILSPRCNALWLIPQIHVLHIEPHIRRDLCQLQRKRDGITTRLLIWPPLGMRPRNVEEKGKNLVPWLTEVFDKFESLFLKGKLFLARKLLVFAGRSMSDCVWTQNWEEGAFINLHPIFVSKCTMQKEQSGSEACMIQKITPLPFLRFFRIPCGKAHSNLLVLFFVPSPRNLMRR